MNEQTLPQEKRISMLSDMVNGKNRWAIDSLMRVTRLCRIFAKELAASATLGGKARQDVTFIFNAANRFLKSVEGGLDEKARAAYEKEILDSDVLAYANILEGLMYLSEGEREAVELLIQGARKKKLYLGVLESGKSVMVGEAKPLESPVQEANVYSV